MYLDEFMARLVKEWHGSLFSLSSVRKIHPRAKEYLHRLTKGKAHNLGLVLDTDKL